MSQLNAFDSAEQALKFSYRHTHGDYPQNQLTRWLKKSSPAADVTMPRGLDAATLAGWVRNAVEGGNGIGGICEPARSLLLARHSVNPQQNLPAKLRVLQMAVAAGMGTGPHRELMVDLLVQCHFGGKTMNSDGRRRPIRQHQIADVCGVSQQTVSSVGTRLRHWLREHEDAALVQVVQLLQRRKLVVCSADAEPSAHACGTVVDRPLVCAGKKG